MFNLRMEAFIKFYAVQIFYKNHIHTGSSVRDSFTPRYRSSLNNSCHLK